MIAFVEISAKSFGKICFTEDQWRILRSHDSRLDEKPRESGYYDLELLCEVETLWPLAEEWGLKLVLKSFPGCGRVLLDDNLLKHRPELSEKYPKEAELYAKHVMTQVHVADLGLLLINKVMVQEDLCTDELQHLLDSGWRIIAVCPPYDQRRPDYILGKRG